MAPKADWFRRLWLPGLAFKAVVIGGGYATGRELVTFFMPSGPRGGMLGMALAMALWSAVCIITFMFSVQTGSRDYRTFFRHLLGPFWPAFEVVFFLGMIVVLAVFAAAAGAIGQAIFGWPILIGSLMLIGSIALFTTFGNESVERLFKYVSFFLYATYGVFLALSLTHFGGRISSAFVTDPRTEGWVTGGLSYAGYNVLAAVLILPVMRHLRNRKDALVAGLLAGPLAMVPAMLFFVSMTAFYPAIQNQVLPSDFMLKQLDIPLFRLVFQAMIFAALLESGTGQIHAINERIARTYVASGRKALSNRARFCITMAILIGSVFVADRIGLVSLIANGYRWLSFAALVIFVLPLMTIGLWRVCRHPPLSASTLVAS
ncbi:hypothetical protein CS053_10865 [Rhodanobacter glycinis]|uniref:Membrane protein YkvI n=1 Tax=Rhodanobacter glycinis TaxID=582702 RepID=A0A5B9DXZ1_9GAMM|nr:hypothetical protein [Rhodanobacter glycinis]QEE24942.1 hypothetical protein CS053_10865 [Rhodanobacter glycinis]